MLKSQLPRETAVETAGELLEALNKGNQQPSPAICGEGSETMHLLPKSLRLMAKI